MDAYILYGWSGLDPTVSDNYTHIFLWVKRAYAMYVSSYRTYSKFSVRQSRDIYKFYKDSLLPVIISVTYYIQIKPC